MKKNTLSFQQPGGESSTTAAACRLQPKSCAAQRRRGTDGPGGEDGPSEDGVLIHGLSVEQYRAVYSSVLQPSVLAALSSSKPSDYVCQVLELKQQLWTRLTRPRLQETVMEDGRVEVIEIFDLT